MAHIAASETRSSGPQWAFAPCVCVARDDRWGRIYESYGETPALVARMETAIDGFQGPAGHLSDNDRVLATAKHFAGDGLTTYGTGSNSQKTGNYPIDQGVDQVDRATFDRLALAPYVDAVRQHHVGSVMPSYSDVDWTEDGLGNPINMHGNRDLITGWLKDQQGFDGFVISDYNGIDHINPGVDTFAQQVATSVNAGVDMFMQPSNFELFETTLTALVNNGTVPMCAHRRRGLADPDQEVPARALRAPLHRPHPPVRGRQRGASRRGAPGGRRVSGAAEEHPLDLAPVGARSRCTSRGATPTTSATRPAAGLSPGRAGRPPRSPDRRSSTPSRHDASKVTFSQDASAPVPHNAIGVVVVGETPYSEGFGDVGGPLWAYDPGDQGSPGRRRPCSSPTRTPPP